MDPNAESSYQNSYQNSYHNEDLFSSSSSSSSTPNHSAETISRKSNESSNLLKESSPQRQKKINSNGSDTRISKEEKLLDFGNSDIKAKKSSSSAGNGGNSRNGDWNEGWDDEAWTKLEVEAPPKRGAQRAAKKS